MGWFDIVAMILKQLSKLKSDLQFPRRFTYIQTGCFRVLLLKKSARLLMDACFQLGGNNTKHILHFLMENMYKLKKEKKS